MDAACKGRGWLLKGNEPDYDRASRIVLDEFRSGRLGRITLEKADSLKMETLRDRNEETKHDQT